ncbi:hypothetical protein [Endozoicomonas sp. Mp262]|uniref:hypothetical protein n=1 Tax=Endozoicomonas sp. Mp262 TaxID=2919499 RepID=UPI0021DABE2D
MTSVIEYGITDAALAELKEKFSVVPSDHDALKKEISALTPYRTKLKARKDELKKPILEEGRKIDAEFKRIDSALLELITPRREAKKIIDDKIKAVKDEQARDIEKEIEVIENLPTSFINSSIDEIKEEVGRLEILREAGKFYTQTKRALIAINGSIDKLQCLLAYKQHEPEPESLPTKAEAMQAVMQECYFTADEALNVLSSIAAGLIPGVTASFADD